MYEVELHLEADLEMKAAAEYYERQAPGLGVEFLSELGEALQRFRRPGSVTWTSTRTTFVLAK